MPLRSLGSVATCAIAAASCVTAAAAAAAPSPLSANSTLLAYLHDDKTIFGSASVSLLGAAPQLLFSGWVYDTYAASLRPGSNATAWKVDVDKVLKYSTLHVDASATGRSDGVNSLVFWNEKPAGIDGTCAIIGFNSASAPDLSGRAPGTWRTNISRVGDCLNVNDGATPFHWQAISPDGATAVGWFFDSDTNVTIVALDAQTGAERWRYVDPAPANPNDRDGWISYGVTISADGRWVVFNSGVVGFTVQYLWVLSTADGSLRDVVVSPGALQPRLSADGGLICASTNPSSGDGGFAVLQWSASAGSYQPAGAGKAPLAPMSPEGWRLVHSAFSTDSRTGATYLGLAWIDDSIVGPTLVAIFDAADVAKGPLNWFANERVPGSDYAVDAVTLECADYLCVAGAWAQKQDGDQPTVIVVSGRAPSTTAPPVLAFASRGSISAVSIVRAPGGAGAPFFVGAAGCSTVGSCIAPGGDAYLWRIEGQ
jgi:hypothetical protein